MFAVLLSCFLGQCGADIHAGYAAMPKPPDVTMGGGFLGGIFNRRSQPQPYCPDGNCRPNNPFPAPHPSLNPDVKPAKPMLVPDEIDAIIPAANRPRNVNGNCVWNAAEGVFLSAGYEEFRGISKRAVKEGWHGAIGDRHLVSALKDAGIPHRLITKKDYTIFEDAAKEGVGVYVQIDNNSHAVACVGLTEKVAYIVDNNPPLTVQTWPRATFDRRWSGTACCPLFRRKRDKQEPPPAVQPSQPSADLTQLQKDAEAAKGRLDALEKGQNQIMATLSSHSDSISKIVTFVEKVQNGSASLPAGPAGPAGPQGPPGPAGRPGETRTTRTRIVPSATP